MGGVRRTLLLGLLLGVGTGPARAGVAVTTSRTQLLYSSDTNPDCSKLFGMSDDALPFNVARLRAAVDGTPPGQPLAYHWSISGAGIIAADLDLGPQDQTPAINGMCGTFGNACILTSDRLRFYSEPSILWVAPTCDGLPKDTRRAFRGGIARVGLKVTAGHRKVGRATATLGYGQTGSITLYVDGDDGLGKRGGIGTGVEPFFGATVAPGSQTPGAVQSYEFNNGGGGSASVPPGCFATIGGHRFDGCTAELVYSTAGTFIASVEAKFADGSGLCDNATVRVLTCSADPRLDVLPSPRLPVYDPDDPRRGTVALKVRIRNASRRTGNLPPCSFLLRGAGMLSCAAAVKVGGTTDNRTTNFDLPHCSDTTTQGCNATADCRPPACPDCAGDELCLRSSHCSKTASQPCAGDQDCDTPLCAGCATGETCVRVLDLHGAFAVVVPPGQSLDLIDETVSLKNEFADTARLTDTWTVNTVNAGSAERTVKYRIRGRPKPGLRR